jgi:hypothetical protein
MHRIERDEFITRIAAALVNGHRRKGNIISQPEALARAKQIADKLPGLFEDRVIELPR